jgi:hypothetical protein
MKQAIRFLCFIISMQQLLGQNKITPDSIYSDVILIDYVSLEMMQKRFELPYTFDGNGMVRSNFHAFTQSNSLPTQFSNAFVFPHYIDESRKANAYNTLKSENRFGAELSLEVLASFSPDSIWKSQGLQLRVGYEQQRFIASQYSSDLFRLLFSGNASFAGKTADFGNTDFTSMAFRTFKVGMMQRNKNGMFNVDLGLVQGQNFTQINFDEAQLFTQEAGSYLDLTWKGNFYQSERESNKFRNQPSLGASISLEARQSFRGKWMFHELVKDLGFVNWNESTQHVQGDTSIRFSGIQFNDILNFDQYGSINIGDTLLNKVRKNEVEGKYLVSLPTLFRIEAFRLMPKYFTLGASIQYRYIVGYKPLASVEIGKTFSQLRAVKIGFMLGGYGGFQTNLTCVLINNTDHCLSLGTCFNEGLISPKKLAGAGFHLNYQIRL